MMHNRTHPVQTFTDILEISGHNLNVELGPNEFFDQTDNIGLFSQEEPEPYKFLSVKNSLIEKLP